MADKVKIPGELESVATGNKVVDVANVKDKIIEMIDSIKDMSAKLKDFYDPESYESNEDEE